ncbi:MAG: YIP1 family protein [Ignavibacteriaceae bacterium]|nr:YIP1 family protein [Ignavibacteriaceae bacterium]
MDNLEQELHEEPEFSHSDKIIGLFSEPSKTFEKMAGYPPKTIDWLLPITLLLIIIVLSRVIIMNNPELAFQVKQQQRESMEKTLNSQVEKGQITTEQKEERLDSMNKPIFLFLGYLGIIVGGFIIFFIITGIYFLFLKFALKGEGTYTTALVAYGLTSYIGIIQIILATIISYIIGRLVNDVSLASLMNSDKTAVTGFILSKLDVITIWSLLILSIGFAKLFKSQTTGKYFGMVFGLWIFWSVFSFWLAKAVPWLNFTK